MYLKFEDKHEVLKTITSHMYVGTYSMVCFNHTTHNAESNATFVYLPKTIKAIHLMPTQI